MSAIPPSHLGTRAVPGLVFHGDVVPHRREKNGLAGKCRFLKESFPEGGQIAVLYPSHSYGHEHNWRGSRPAPGVHFTYIVYIMDLFLSACKVANRHVLGIAFRFFLQDFLYRWTISRITSTTSIYSPTLHFELSRGNLPNRPRVPRGVLLLRRIQQRGLDSERRIPPGGIQTAPTPQRVSGENNCGNGRRVDGRKGSLVFEAL